MIKDSIPSLFFVVDHTLRLGKTIKLLEVLKDLVGPDSYRLGSIDPYMQVENLLDPIRS